MTARSLILLDSMTEYSIILEHVFEHKKTRCSSRTVFLAQGELFAATKANFFVLQLVIAAAAQSRYPALISFYVFFSILELLQNTIFCGNTDRHAAKLHSNCDWKSNPGDFRLSDGCFFANNKPHCGNVFPQLRVMPYFPREVAAIHGDIASTKIFPRRARRVNRTFDNGRWREKEGACERANERARDDLATAPSRSAGIEFQAPEGQKRGRTDRRGPFSFV